MTKAMEDLEMFLYDYDGSELPDGTTPMDGLTVGHIRAVLKECKDIIDEIVRQGLLVAISDG